MNDKAARFRGGSRFEGRKTEPWKAGIDVTADSEGGHFNVGCFAREEDAARAWDRVNIAKLGGNGQWRQGEGESADNRLLSTALDARSAARPRPSLCLSLRDAHQSGGFYETA